MKSVLSGILCGIVAVLFGVGVFFTISAATNNDKVFTTVAKAAGSHSSHHVKFIGGNGNTSVEKKVNEWIEEMNSDPDFNIINIEFDMDTRNPTYIDVMVWYEV